LKGDGPSGPIAQSIDAEAFSSGVSQLDNDRVTVSTYNRASSRAGRHFHRRDTVVVFTAKRAARAIFVRAGVVHDDERLVPEDNVTVFELK